MFTRYATQIWQVGTGYRRIVTKQTNTNKCICTGGSTQKSIAFAQTKGNVQLCTTAQCTCGTPHSISRCQHVQKPYHLHTVMLLFTSNHIYSSSQEYVQTVQTVRGNVQFNQLLIGLYCNMHNFTFSTQGTKLQTQCSLQPKTGCRLGH